MKKFLSILLCALMVVTLAACSNNDGGDDQPVAETFEIAVVTDVGQLMDKGFNQGTWEGAEGYAKANNVSYKYYQPANGSDATDNDRIEAMNQAIENGAKVIVTPGFLQATAIETVAKEHPEVKFIFVDGWAMGLDNVTAIIYKEEQAGFLAGYAAVKEGYTKLGFTGGGGGANPACCRFGHGFVEGADLAAKEIGVTVDMKYSWNYGSTFSASPELQTQIAGWYANGTEVVFACGGSMFQSVLSAAAEYDNAAIIGVDVDQSNESSKVITSAMKGLSASVNLVLTQFYAGEWDSKLANVAQNLGAADDAVGLPTDTWSMTNFTVDEYNALFAKLVSGEITPVSEYPEDWSSNWAAEFTNVNLDYEG